MLSRSVRLWLWNHAGRGTAQRLWDRLPFVGAAGIAPSAADPYQGCAGTFPIVREEGALFDASRESRLRYRLFRPNTLQGKLPIVVFSIPMGWGRKYPSPTSDFIGEKVAAGGYLALSVWHDDSDRLVLPFDLDDVPSPKDYISVAIRDQDTPHHRFLDVSFVIDTLEEWNAGEGPLAGHIDLDRLGLSGHSFGAHTTLALIGQKYGPERRSYKDARIKAAALYSLSPCVEPDVPAEIYADVDCPVCHMAGSRDCSWSEPTVPEDRLWPFHKIPASNQYRVVLKGADHVTFSGRRADEGIASPREARNHQLISSTALAFWDAYLREDASAKTWLDDELPRVLGCDGRLKRK